MRPVGEHDAAVCACSFHEWLRRNPEPAPVEEPAPLVEPVVVLRCVCGEPASLVVVVAPDVPGAYWQLDDTGEPALLACLEHSRDHEERPIPLTSAYLVPRATLWDDAC